MGRRRIASVHAGLFILAVMLCCGCTQRQMTITSNPSGALVFMNDQEVGRTPVTRDFTWYGWYDVQIRKEGFETLKTRQRVIAPIWEWPPFDLLAALWPGHITDKRHYNYTLQPASTQPADPDQLLARAHQLQTQLLSSQYTRKPATTRAATGPSTTAATGTATAP